MAMAVAPADDELIARYLRGDEGAAAELVRRHAPGLARFLAVQGAPDFELEDLVQEALFRAFRSLRSFRGGASFRSWLLTIGSNLLKDRGRQWKRSRLVELKDEIADSSGNPEGEAEASWAVDRLRDGLRHLAKLQREVFLLRAYEGLDYGEISRALGISQGAARVHYHHAVRRLKQWMSG